MSNVFFAVYDEITGAILRTGSAPESMIEFQALPGERVKVTRVALSDATYYVSDVALGLIAEKPPLGALANKTTLIADGVDRVTITNLPIPTDYRLSGPVADSAIIGDGALVISLDFPGVYTVELKAMNRLTQFISITGL